MMSQNTPICYQSVIDPHSDSTAARILRLVGDHKNVLELGCVPGNITQALIDFNHCSVKKITVQKRPHSPDWKNTLGSETYDVILVMHTLEYVADPICYLQELKLFLNSEGYLVLLLPNVGHSGIIAALLNQTFLDAQTRLYDAMPVHFFSRQDITALFKQTNFLEETCEEIKIQIEASEFVHYWLQLPETQRQLIDQYDSGLVYQYLIRVYPNTAYGENQVLKNKIEQYRTTENQLLKQQAFQKKRHQDLLDILRLYQDYVSALEPKASQWDRLQQLLPLSTVFAILKKARRLWHRFRTPQTSLDSYQQWFEQYYRFSPQDIHLLKKAAFSLADLPKISILFLVDDAAHTPNDLERSLNSIAMQTYPHFDCRCAVSPQLEPTKQAEYQALLNRYFQSDHRFDGLSLDPSLYKEINYNTLLELAQGEWVLCLKTGDWLNPDALYWYAHEVTTYPEARLVYSDEDCFTSTQGHFAPQCKPDWNFEYLLAKNYIQNSIIYHRETLIYTFKKFNLRYQQAFEYAMLLHFGQYFGRENKEKLRHVPRILYHAQPRHANLIEETQCVSDYRESFQIQTVSLEENQIRRVTYGLPATLPRISLIIPTRNGLEIIRQCIDSILTLTTYPHYEIIIVDNGSDDPAILTYFETITAAHAFIRVLPDPQPFNYAALNNHAVRHAHGEFVLLLNNDTEVITPNWLEIMLQHAIRPHIGAVGARLWYSDKRLQHGGVILIYGVAAHAHLRLTPADRGYMDRAICTQAFSAVTAACLLVRKQLYEKVGGLDETLQVGFNDVDFCLKLHHAGYTNIWTPYAELYHHESATRGYDVSPEKLQRAETEREIIRKRFGSFLDQDPYYNPNLVFNKEDFSLAFPPRISKLPTTLL